MRGLETLLGGLLLLSGLSMPGVPLIEDPMDNSTVEGEAVFETAEYAGDALVEAQDGALWAEGGLQATLTADEVTVTRYVWEGAKLDAKAGDGPSVSAHYGAGTVERTTTTYENATIEIDGSSDGVASLWRNASRGPAHFSLDLAADETPTIAASPSGTILWMKWAGFDHHVEGPLVALAHDGARLHDVWVKDGTFDHLTARGALDLNVVGGTVTVEHADGSRTYETGVEQTEAGTELAEGSVRTKRVHALVSVTDATLTTGFEESEAVFMAQEPSWSFNGSLRFDAREGRMETGAENVSLSNDTVTLLGDTTLELAPQGETPDPSDPQPNMDDERPTPPIETRVESDARSVSVDGEPVQVPSAPPIPEEVTFWGKVLGLALVAFSVLKKIPAFLLALLARDPLENDRRQEIYDFLQERGMAHTRLIARELDIPVSSVTYHIRLLREADLVIRVEREGYTVYFACDRFEVEDKERLALLASSTREEIARLLADEGAITQQDLAEALEFDQSTVSKHLRKLADAGLVEGEGSNGIEYEPASLLEAWFSRRRDPAD